MQNGECADFHATFSLVHGARNKLFNQAFNSVLYFTGNGHLRYSKRSQEEVVLLFREYLRNEKIISEATDDDLWSQLIKVLITVPPEP